MTSANVAPEEEKKSAWETESGLVDDVDGWIANGHFGKKAEYAAKVAMTEGGTDESAGLMGLFDLVDETGEVIASQGYSIGSGWTVSEDGFTITHPKRSNVVKNTVYGQLMDKVRSENGLNLDLDIFGIPTDARSWNGMGFHWNMAGHATLVKGEEKSGLMPTQWLGVKMELRTPAPEGYEEVPAEYLYVEPTEEGQAAAAPAPAAAPVKATPAGTGATAAKPAPAAKPAATAAKPAAKPAAVKQPATLSALEQELVILAKKSTDATVFQLAAVKMKGVTKDDALMARVTDEGENSFFNQYHNAA